MGVGWAAFPAGECIDRYADFGRNLGPGEPSAEEWLRFGRGFCSLIVHESLHRRVVFAAAAIQSRLEALDVGGNRRKQAETGGNKRRNYAYPEISDT
jgi:hypothetical protein